jgi:hypothetical protein
VSGAPQVLLDQPEFEVGERFMKRRNVRVHTSQ